MQIDDKGLLEFDGEKVVGTAIVTKNLTEKDIEIIIDNGFSGGIGYWGGLDTKRPEWSGKPKGEYLSSWAVKTLLDGGSLKFYDVEETEDDADWILTLEKLVEGFALNAKNRPHDSDLEQGDAATADCIIQYALFGKLVFG